MDTGSVMPETTFTVGEKFSSVEEFEKKLEEYKKQAFVEFWRRDSRTITAARKRGIDRPLSTAVCMVVDHLSPEEKEADALRESSKCMCPD